MVLSPLPLADLYRSLQADPEVQEPPWLCQILATLSLLEGSQPFLWPQTTPVPWMSLSPAWGIPTIPWYWHCHSLSEEQLMPAGEV